MPFKGRKTQTGEQKAGSMREKRLPERFLSKGGDGGDGGGAESQIANLGSKCRVTQELRIESSHKEEKKWVVGVQPGILKKKKKVKLGVASACGDWQDWGPFGTRGWW